jgi:hypothetical protein
MQISDGHSKLVVNLTKNFGFKQIQSESKRDEREEKLKKVKAGFK